MTAVIIPVTRPIIREITPYINAVLLTSIDSKEVILYYSFNFTFAPYPLAASK